MKKTVFTSFTILCLLSTVFVTVLVVNIHEVKAVMGIVYIRADGSVDPPSPAISTADNVTYTFTGNVAGRVIIQRDNITVDGSGHTLSWNDGIGINLTNANNVTIKNFTIQGFRHGLWLEQSTNNTILGNNITGNFFGVWIFASDNTVHKNKIANSNSTGIVMDLDSSNNTITENEIIDNTIGVWLIMAFDNRLYHNNFIDNMQPVSVSVLGFANSWDNGYPSGGNSWSGYADLDLYSGIYQNETGSDGIGDNPYFFSLHNQDNYPLLTPITPLYHELLDDYSKLQSIHDSLNQTYYELAENHTSLQNNFDSLTTGYNELQEQYDSINSTYNSLLTSYNSLQTSYNSLQADFDEMQLEQEPIITELNNIRNLMYVFITTTVFLALATIYFGMRKPETKRKRKTRTKH